MSGPFKSCNGTIRENSFSYLILGDTLPDYHLTGIFLNTLAFLKFYMFFFKEYYVSMSLCA